MTWYNGSCALFDYYVYIYINICIYIYMFTWNMTYKNDIIIYIWKHIVNKLDEKQQIKNQFSQPI